MVERMTSTLVHRGPDGSGFWYEGPVGFGFRRLAILDLSPAGNQPMVSREGDLVLVFNGEIFNYVELRSELKALGHTFQSTGDTEVLLAAWRQWGEDCLDKLIGMYAFAIWDRQTNELFGARDRHGIKPLFWHQGPDVLLFGSEIKAILASGLYTVRENWPAIAGYVTQERLDDGAQTCFEGIQQIPPGHAFAVRMGAPLRHWQYWSWPPPAGDREVSDAPQQIGDLLEESVRLRLRSDVPVGVCLSGGLDSTAIICAVARQRKAAGDPSPVMAFSFNAPEFDESQYIAETIRQTGARYVPLVTDPRRLWDDMPRTMHFHDEPLHAMNALVGYQLMRLARQHGAVVVLNGQGADETLGGYSNYYEDYWCTLMETGRRHQALAEIDAYARTFGKDPAELRAKVRRLRRFLTLGRLPGYRLLANAARYVFLSQHQYFATDFAQRAPFPGAPTHNLDEVMRRGVTVSPLPLYLRIEDRNSMAHSVEARLPFLDNKLVEYAIQLPIDWRIRGPWNKYQLREALRGRIPELVRTRVDKMGFPTPAPKWFGGPLFEPVRDILNSKPTRERGIYHVDRMLAHLDGSRGGNVRDWRSMFCAVNIEMWLAMNTDRRQAAA